MGNRDPEMVEVSISDGVSKLIEDSHTENAIRHHMARVEMLIEQLSDSAHISREVIGSLQKYANSDMVSERKICSRYIGIIGHETAGAGAVLGRLLKHELMHQIVGVDQPRQTRGGHMSDMNAILLGGMSRDLRDYVNHTTPRRLLPVPDLGWSGNGEVAFGHGNVIRKMVAHCNSGVKRYHREHPFLNLLHKRIAAFRDCERERGITIVGVGSDDSVPTVIGGKISAFMDVPQYRMDMLVIEPMSLPDKQSQSYQHHRKFNQRLTTKMKARNYQARKR